MKQDRLKEEELLKVKEYFREHPLLRSCQCAFERYQAYMAPLLFAPEEVFYEAATIIDQIHKLPQTNEVKFYIAGLWNELRIKFSKWEKMATQQNLDKAVSSVLYSVTMVMNRHWTTFYYSDVTHWLLQTILTNMKIDYNEMVYVLSIFLDQSDGIEEWINNVYDGRFSEEIETVLKGKRLFNSAISYPKKANVIIKRLHEFMEGKSKPKDVMMPVRAAMDAGAIRRPTDEEFYNEFGVNRVKGKSSFNDYTNPDKTPYRGADFEAMKDDFRKIIEE